MTACTAPSRISNAGRQPAWSATISATASAANDAVRYPRLAAAAASPRSFGDGAVLQCDFSQARSVSVGNNNSDHAVVHRDRNAHMHIVVQANSLGSPAGVQAQVLRQDAGHESNEKVGVRNANIVRALDFTDYAGAVGVERIGFDVPADEEVRNGRPALRGALGHDASERAGKFEAA